MDPASAAVVARVTSELAALVIGLLRQAGKTADAAEIAAILKRSDDIWRRIKARIGED